MKSPMISVFKSFTQIFNTLLLFSAFFYLSTIPAAAQNLDVPYVPTPNSVVEKMLDMAQVRPGDYVIDLGSGDGRIVIAAVKRGAFGHGVDLNPQRIKEARQNALEAEIEDQVMFLEQDLFETDFSKASVITMYLLSSVNMKLRPKLLETLEPGSRIVSHSFDMGDWEPDKKTVVDTGAGNHTVYFWVIPARVEGSWSWNINGEPFELSVSQKFQNAELELSSQNSQWQTSDITINGKRFSFKAMNGEVAYLYSGQVEGNTITGYAQIYRGNSHAVQSWNAERN